MVQKAARKVSNWKLMHVPFSNGTLGRLSGRFQGRISGQQKVDCLAPIHPLVRGLRGGAVDRAADDVRLAVGRLQRHPLQHRHILPDLGAHQGRGSPVGRSVCLRSWSLKLEELCPHFTDNLTYPIDLGNFPSLCLFFNFPQIYRHLLFFCHVHLVSEKITDVKCDLPFFSMHRMIVLF